MRALTRHAKLLRDMRDRAPREHPLNQDQTTRRSEPRITVDQEKASSSVTLDTTKNGGLLPNR